MRKKCSVIILAAGRSSRMGKPKFALPFNNERSFLEEIASQYKTFGCREIVVVLNREGTASLKKQSFDVPENVVYVTNIHLEWERFYSIKIGIQKLSNQLPIFIHNVDNPFVSNNVLKKIYSVPSDFTVPMLNGRGGHPILISEHVQKQIIAEKNNDLIFSDFMNRFEKKIVEVKDKRVLVNINTQEEYKRLFQ